MNLFGVLGISGSALAAERQRAEVVAANLANAETTRTPEGGPYRRQQVVFASSRARGFAGLLARWNASGGQSVRIAEVRDDPAPPIRRYDPSHPDADAQGYVAYPAINPIEEMVDLMSATRAYQLNVAATRSTKAMIQQTLEILR